MKKAVIINSPIKQSLSRSWSMSLVAKIVVNAIIDEKIVVDTVRYDLKTNRIPFLAQRDASWIRILFRDDTHLDLVSAEILLIASKSGVLINLLGDCDEFNDELVASRVAHYAKRKQLSKVSPTMEFSYRKHMGRQIKTKMSKIMRTKSNILVDKFQYATARKQALKAAIELVIEKKHIEENWASIAGRIAREMERIDE